MPVVVVVMIMVTMPPLPILLLLVVIQLAEVAMIAVGFQNPLVVIDVFVVIPAMIIVVVRVIDSI
jgi:hypothetical protein